MSQHDDMIIDNGLMSMIYFVPSCHMPLSCAQAPSMFLCASSASMVIQYRGVLLLTMWPKQIASSTNTSDSCIANMSSVCFLSSCTAESPLNHTCFIGPLGVSVTAVLAQGWMLQDAGV